jgi:hypothetical protein
MHDMFRWIIPHLEEFTFGDHLIWNTSSNSEKQHNEGSVMVWAVISWYSLSPITVVLFTQNYWNGVHGQLGNQVHPKIWMLFLNNRAVLKDNNVQFTQMGLFSHGLKSMKLNFNIFPGQHNHHSWTSLNYSGKFFRPDWGTDSHLQHL